MEVTKKVEAFRIRNGTLIELPDGWSGIVVDQKGPQVWITARGGGFVTVERSRIENRKVVR